MSNWMDEREVILDGDKLKADLKDYFGTAMFSCSPLAVFDLSKVERASSEELIEIAQKNGFDLGKYKIE